MQNKKNIKNAANINNIIPNMLRRRITWKPIQYKWAVDAKMAQECLHWLHTEVNMSADKQEFYSMGQKEQNTLVRILRFFTQTDVNVAEVYVKYYIPYFANCPEITMMLISFANMEGIHILGYQFLLDTLNLPDADMSYINEHEALMNKQNFMYQFSAADPESTAITMAIVSGFIEGVVLFSSFAIINYFPYFMKKLKGVGQIVNMSIRDENLHAKSLIKLFKKYTQEIGLDIKRIERKIHSIVTNLINIEKSFIDFCLKDGDLDNLTKEDLYKFVEYLSDIRLIQLGFEPLYGYNLHSENPLPWTNIFLSDISEDANFFENKPTDYCSAGALYGQDENISWV